MGVPTRLITDGMAAHLMSRGQITHFVTAADRITMDGSVVNKVGTLQIAISAHAFDVPYVALVQAPDRQAPTADDVELEDRDGDEVLHCLGRRTASRAGHRHLPGVRHHPAPLRPHRSSPTAAGSPRRT